MTARTTYPSKRSVVVRRERPLAGALIFALLFGAYFLRHYVTLVIFTAIAAYMFNPMFLRLSKHLKKPGTAASLTLVISFVILIIPLTLILLATVFQIKNLLDDFPTINAGDIGRFGQEILDWVNSIITKIPGVHAISLAQLDSSIQKAIEAVAHALLNVLTSSVSGVASFFTSAILYIYVFLAFLKYQTSLIDTITRLNPLGPERSQVYLAKMAATTKATVRGQFIIAICQGVVGAIVLYIAGLHSVFFFMMLVLTFLCLVPLGSGLALMPIGVIMLVTGNIWQGIVVLLGYFLIVSNIDNVLRPRLVGRHVALNSALTLLSVFAGISMFGFLGIIVGPIIMILIVTTIQMYLEVPQPT